MSSYTWGARAVRSGHKTSVEAEIRQADDLARRVSGSVMLVVDGDEDQWCAAYAAVDESVKLRIAEPRRGWRRWKPTEGEVWLSEHGFVPELDAWTLPVPSTTDARECARLLADAARNGLGVDSGAQLVRALVHPGALAHEWSAPDAPHEEHIAAALRSLVSVGRGRAAINGGCPSELWAWVWVLDDGRSLLVEYEPPRAAAEEDTWTVPLTLDAARAAAQDLTRREGRATARVRRADVHRADRHRLSAGDRRLDVPTARR